MRGKRLDYLIALTYDKTYKGYVADVVNLYGCMSQGKTKKEALANVEKAIRAYMEAFTKHRENKNVQFMEKAIETPLPSFNA